MTHTEELREKVWDTEQFKILEGALRHQGVSKPLTKEFYNSLKELNEWHTTEVTAALTEALDSIEASHSVYQHHDFTMTTIEKIRKELKATLERGK